VASRNRTPKAVTGLCESAENVHYIIHAAVIIIVTTVITVVTKSVVVRWSCTGDVAGTRRVRTWTLGAASCLHLLSL
jgi:hypothetical protein